MSKHALTILVRMPNWLGDSIMALPALRHLTDALPDAGIYLAGRNAFRGIFSAQPGVAGFIEAPASGLGKLLKGMAGVKRAALAATGTKPIDLGLLFTNSLSSAAWLWRSGAKARIGYNCDGRQALLTHPVPCGSLEKSWHFINYYMWLARFAESIMGDHAGVERRELKPLDEYLAPSLAVSTAGREEAAGILHKNGLGDYYAVIAPASAYGAVKDWPVEHYRDLVKELNRRFSLPILVTGSKGQAEICASIVQGQKAAVNLAGKTSLEGFIGLLANAVLFVGGDSGGSHAAAALGIPTLILFGITNPSRTRATGDKVVSLGGGASHDVKLDSDAAKKAAKQALAAITPRQVLEAAREYL